jgi:FKBP-type peptidyl-prolyl cis-trans isomerase FklB
MKFKTILTGLLVCTQVITNAQNVKDSLSYSLGIPTATGLKEQNLLDTLDLDSFIQAFRDIRAGKLSISIQEAQSILSDFFTNRYTREKAENLAAGQSFLAKNAAEPGVVTLPSGMQYKIIQPGQGEKPKATDTVRVHYEGWLVNGKVFDSSRKRGEPAEFPLNRVIAGWTEGLQHIAEGGTIELYIPPQLGYGDVFKQGSPIPPNSTLIFEVELLNIVRK